LSDDGQIRNELRSSPEIAGLRYARQSRIGSREILLCRIEKCGRKRYVRRSKSGQFTEKQVNVGRSLAADRRSKSKTVAKKGEGDRGDRPAR
jgi:hypothetical protein